MKESTVEMHAILRQTTPDDAADAAAAAAADSTSAKGLTVSPVIGVLAQRTSSTRRSGTKCLRIGWNVSNLFHRVCRSVE